MCWRGHKEESMDRWRRCKECYRIQRTRKLLGRKMLPRWGSGVRVNIVVLREWLICNRMQQQALGELCGISRGHMKHLVAQDAGASYLVRREMTKVTGVAHELLWPEDRMLVMLNSPPVSMRMRRD